MEPAAVREMFTSLAFTVDWQPATRPRARELVLYRGSTPYGRTGPSWPACRAHFARFRQEIGADASVWQVTVTPEQVLAVFSDEEECILAEQGLGSAVRPAPADAGPSKRTRRWIQKLGNQRRTPPTASGLSKRSDPHLRVVAVARSAPHVALTPPRSLSWRPAASLQRGARTALRREAPRLPDSNCPTQRNKDRASRVRAIHVDRCALREPQPPNPRSSRDAIAKHGCSRRPR